MPEIKGLLLNIGGDIFASGHPAPGTPWTISVANPARSEDNAPPLTQLRLSDRAVSTSAAYERGYNIGGKHYSHIFDPRTGQPAEGSASATVIAPYSANSNALATTLCVLKPTEGLELAKQIPDVECLIIGADGQQYRSAHFAAYEVPPVSRWQHGRLQPPRSLRRKAGPLAQWISSYPGPQLEVAGGAELQASQAPVHGGVGHGCGRQGRAHHRRVGKPAEVSARAARMVEGGEGRPRMGGHGHARHAFGGTLPPGMGRAG